ncbi:MAG TPA: hypothetical protein V6C81_01425 [Planktothrix sp.]
MIIRKSVACSILAALSVAPLAFAGQPVTKQNALTRFAPKKSTQNVHWETDLAKQTINPLPPICNDNAMWFRYYRAAEADLVKHDVTSAKPYLFAALNTLDKQPTSIEKNDMMFAVKLSAVEQYLEGMYPSDWSKPVKDAKGKELSEDDTMKLRGEQIATLYRIAQVNAKFVPARDLLRTKEIERYQSANIAYQKAKAEYDAKKLSAKSGTTPQ